MTKNSNPFPVPMVPPVLRKPADWEKFASKIYSSFFSFPIEQANSKLQRTSAAAWEEAGQCMALKVFHAAAKRVPAYSDYLKKNRISPQKIQTIQDFKAVPPVDKKNYLEQYELKDLSWDGQLHSSQVISVSSGSTGDPFFWPRGVTTEIDTTYQFEITLSNFFDTRNTTTLFVNAFAMGMYVGGPLTMNSVLRIAQKGHKIMLVTPGYSLVEIRRIVKKLGPHYQQVIIASYPPFAKDIVDDGIDHGVDWKNLKTKFWLAGEGYSESWRDYVAELTGANGVTDLINVYGTADSAMLGHETPTSNVVRKVFNQNNGIRREVFGDERLPSLLQYYPSLRYFEHIDDRELIFTASSGIPLVRYNIHDRGGIFSYDKVEQQLRDLGTDLTTELEKYHVSPQVWQLPFVYVFGRRDFTSVFYGANIYPENIKIALETCSKRNEVTGRFVMFTSEDGEHNQRLVLNLECAQHVKPEESLKQLLQEHIVQTLLELNSEYGVVHSSRKNKSRPVVNLFTYGDESYFGKKGVKQNWAMHDKDDD